MSRSSVPSSDCTLHSLIDPPSSLTPFFAKSYPDQYQTILLNRISIIQHLKNINQHPLPPKKYILHTSPLIFDQFPQINQLYLPPISFKDKNTISKYTFPFAQEQLASESHSSRFILKHFIENMFRSVYADNSTQLVATRLGDTLHSEKQPIMSYSNLSQNQDLESSKPIEIEKSSPSKNEKEKWKITAAGVGAGLVSSICTCPLDVVKTRLQYQAILAEKGMVLYKGTLGTLKRIYFEEGVFGLYRGIKPMLLGYIPTWGIYFSSYEAMKRSLSQMKGFSNFDSASHMISAITAGSAASITTNPIWVLKTRFMVIATFSRYQITIKDIFI
ncbi:hypothetical protein BB559_006013 [Furculomyces boomerangus]|uniref:Mitochondrial carrier protein n=2 Tax=Harpellales TaxID=61421 RepID=A0A2T9Y192_9FUNG|nr:hypothetical protein BB559_006653 [Furculomyces boomerangus]PVU87491.1 hypothetical protein BB559_006013 [Furculomyces boomerangus]PWA00396.1 hypothetical protein BB558_003553 [Smittium angustum]